MKTLELDEDVSSIVSQNGQKVFMKKRKGATSLWGLATSEHQNDGTQTNNIYGLDLEKTSKGFLRF